jgi:glycosyltransferase involved in cell wall biosynthesis
MHICYITSEYPKEGHPHGGIGTFVKTISHKLVKYGHEVTVIGINTYTGTDEFEQDQGVSVYRLQPKIIKGLTWYFNFRILNKKIFEIHDKRPIDVVETAELGLAFIKKIKTISYIIRLHGGHHFFAEAENRKVSWWKAYQEKRSFFKADGFIAVSEYVKNHTAKFLSYNGKPLEIIRYPINLEIFRPQSEIRVEPKTILFAGTICEKKGIHKLIEAIPKVLAKQKGVRLYIYGRDWYLPDGSSYSDYLKKEVLPKLGKVASKIFFRGPVSLETLSEKYAAAEVCVFPSLMETQGLVAPEAMAMEKLVIFSKCGPGPETIEHKKTGLLCNPYDSDNIAENILWALNHKNEAHKIGQRAKEFVLSNFDIEAVSDKNLRFYKYLKIK